MTAPLLVGERRRKRLALAIKRHVRTSRGTSDTEQRLAVIALGNDAGVTPREAIRAWRAIEVPAEAHCRLAYQLRLSPLTLERLAEGEAAEARLVIDWRRLGIFASLATAGLVITVDAVIAALERGGALPQVRPAQRAIAEASGASLRAVNDVLKGGKVGADNFVRLVAHAGVPVSALHGRSPRSRIEPANPRERGPVSRQTSGVTP